MTFTDVYTALMALIPDARMVLRDGPPLEGETELVLDDGKRRGILWLDARPMPTVEAIVGKRAEIIAAGGVDPDPKAFEGALKAIFADEALVLNGLMTKYPLFLWSLRDRNWPYVAGMLAAALRAADLTPAQYNAIVAAAQTHRIPGVA